MIIRKLKIDEADNLKYLFKHKNFERYKNNVIKEIENNIRDIYIMINDNKFIGEITVHYNNKSEKETISNIRVYLSAYRVLREYQGKGLGQQLLKFVIEDLEQKGYTEFTIGVEEDNKNAIHIYNKFGFNELLARLSETHEDNTYEYNLYLRKNVNKKIEKLIKNNNLGNKILSINKVVGGLSHRMYKVITDVGVYAIKELNQGIMKRKDTYSNFVFSEKVTDIVIKNGISAVGAIKLDNDIMKNIDNDYFMIFDWVDGKVLLPDEITENHCRIIAKNLANIHNINFREIEEEDKKKISLKNFKWDYYLELSKVKNKRYTKLLEENCELLKEINYKSNKVLEYARNNLIISHTDLDRKNVIWQDNNPIIIDWEASSYINPTIEIIQVAWYWSGGENQNIDYNKFKIIIDTYKANSKIKIDSNIKKLIYANVYSGLEWIDYNLKRSLCIENTYNEEEIKLAENEVIQSINEIIYNVNEINKMIEMIN